ncbi:hypothetical protein GX441_01185 [bacterium]|nr:hypothetical protein [bacterium]
MTRILGISLGILFLMPVFMRAQEKIYEVTETGLIEYKPKAFYYEIDPYQPIGIMLGSTRFILDDNLITQVEKSVGRSTFMADPFLLRVPVNVTSFYDLDRQTLAIDVSSYQERNIASWTVNILDARGNTFRTIQQNGALPATISWDGRGDDPSQVMAVGDVYSFIIILNTKDGSQMRKIGRPIDLNGIAYENVVAVKEAEIASYDVGAVSQKIANYYQYVLNRLKEKGFTSILIKASDTYIAETAKQYLDERLYHTKINVQEVPEYARVEFVFQ